MTIQQRIEILKELPVGSAVTVYFGKRHPRKAIKIDDGENCMVVEMVVSSALGPIPYERITCETIEKAEAVIDRLTGREFGINIHTSQL